MIENVQQECPVCCTQYPKSLSTSISQTCSHKFCQNCCLQHIESRLESFQQIRCLAQSCQQKLTKQSPIYRQLSKQNQRKFQKYLQFVAIQGNRNLRACRNGDCWGVVDGGNKMGSRMGKGKGLELAVCGLCGAEHCAGCWELKHAEGEKCKIVSEEEIRRQDGLMRSLNFRKCPTCSVWVQKNGGCQYLICKCKTQFCFNCGSVFQKDPCRKTLVSQTQMSIRRMTRLSSLIPKPQSVLSYVCFPPKLLVTLLYTIVTNILFMALIFGFLLPLLYLTSPGALIIYASQTSLSKTKVLILRILLVLFYPVVGLGVTLTIFVLFVSYPVMRLLYSTHMYDQFDRFMHQMAELYLRGVRCMMGI